MTGRLAVAKKIAQEAARLGSEQRSQAYIADACGDDSQLAAETRLQLHQMLAGGDSTQASGVKQSADRTTGATVKIDAAPDGRGTTEPPDDLGAANATQLSGAIVDDAKTTRPPPEIPGYEIQELIGQGGMGVVYRALDTKLKRSVALKMMRSAGLDSSNLARFQAEAQAVAKLQHPNVVQIFEVGEHDGEPYLALEYVDGLTLSDYSDRHNLTPREAAEIMLVVAQAVHSVHELGIVHRDLKPSNILIRTSSNSAIRRADDRGPRTTQSPTQEVSTGIVPKITDFGLAKQLDGDGEATRTEAVVGTPNYMAPEQARGEMATTATDIYALGGTLYFLLTGRPPFQGKNVVDIAKKLETEEPKLPRSYSRAIPRDLEAICLKCLEKKQDERYDTALDLAEDLARFLDGVPVRAARPSVLYRARKYYQRRRSQVLTNLAALGVALIGGLFAVYFVSRAIRERADRRISEGLRLVEELEDDLPGLLPKRFEDRRHEMEEWLANVKTLENQLDGHRVFLQQVQERASSSDDGLSSEDAQRKIMVEKLIDGILKLVEDDGPYEQVAHWAALTPRPEEVAQRWKEVLPVIDEQYDFRMQVDDHLYPLGLNEQTQLWEFAEVETGHLPERGDRGQIVITPTMGLVLVLLSGGLVEGGSSSNEIDGPLTGPGGIPIYEPQYQVRLSPFLISKYEVMQGIWTRQGYNNNSFNVGPTHPVDSVEWERCNTFCRPLGLQLPSEVQAEYAMRGGTKTPFYFGTSENIEEHAWWQHNSEKVSHPVGQKKPNPFGLHDVHGNLLEWCVDIFHNRYDPEDGSLDPVNTTPMPEFAGQVERRSLRGGSYEGKHRFLRSANRYFEKIDQRWRGFGLRPIRKVVLR